MSHFVVKDKFFLKAKKEGYRARSSYKLLGVLDRFPKFLPKKTRSVLDLWAAPGSFLQVLRERLAYGTLIVGVDLQAIEPIDGVQTIVSDIFDPQLAVTLTESFGTASFDVIVSDLAPRTTGIFAFDQQESVEINTQALSLAPLLLKKGGNMLFKVFVGEDFPPFIASVKRQFEYVKVFVPEAVRNTSHEQYVVAHNYHGAPIAKEVGLES